MKTEQIIKDGQSFKSTEINVDLKTYTEAIEHYYSKFNDAIELKSNIPIFLDTNILLRYYSISFKQRELLKNFFIENSEKIHISNQVQKEFIKNREEVIQKYFHSALESMSENLKSDIIDRTHKFKNENKEILKDFDYVDKAIEKQIKSFEKIQNDLKKDIENLRKDNKQLHFKDEFLDIINKFNQDFKLLESEIDFLKKEFDSQTKSIDKQTLKNEIKKANFSIPGLADILEKSENPYGDYFIYHEMLKCCLQKNTDIIFLTYDSTKGDWMRLNKEPHIHYLLKTYELSNKSIFILDAERFFENHLSTNFESLINGKIDYYSVENPLHQDIIIEFVSLERIIRIIAEFVAIEKAEIKPINLLIKNLEEMNIIDNLHSHQIRELSIMKNHLSHRSKDFVNQRYNNEQLENIYELIIENIQYLNQIYSDL